MACSLVVKDALLLLLLAMIVFLWVIVSQSGLLEGCMFALCFSQLSRAGEARGCLGVSFEHTAMKGDLQYPWSISLYSACEDVAFVLLQKEQDLPTVQKNEDQIRWFPYRSSPGLPDRSDRVGASERRPRRRRGIRPRWSRARWSVPGSIWVQGPACWQPWHARPSGPVPTRRKGRMNMR